MAQLESQVATAGIALAVTGLSSIPHVIRLATSPWRLAPSHQAWYEDVDGKSTPEAVADFGSSLRRSKWATLLSALASMGIAAAVFVRAWGASVASGAGLPIEDVVSLAAWLLVAVVQVPAIWTCWTEAYALGLWSFLSGVFVTAIPVVQFASDSYVFARETNAYLKLAQFVFGLCFVCSTITIRRRPHLVDEKGRDIDWQYSVSAADRYTYAFMWRIIDTAKEKEDLDVNDIFRPDQAVTARVLMDDWTQRGMPEQRPLWLQIVTAHFWSLAFSWLLVLFQAVATYAPAFFVLKVVEMMEFGNEERRGSKQVWLLVVGIMVALLVDAFIIHIFYNFVWNRVSIPVRSQLEALVFKKSLLTKDIKDLRKSKDGQKDAQDGSQDDSPEDDDSSDGGNNQTNLIGYDAERVSSFCSNVASVIPVPLFETMVCYTLLGHLLGWRTLAVLVAFSAVFVTGQIKTFKSFARAEERVMEARDVKVVTVTEALRGIRQIKFSAAEEYWGSKIDADRQVELKRIWALFMWDTALWLMYNAVSIALTVSALTSYSYFEGPLKPSVAFSAIAALSMYGDTLYFLPDGVAYMMQSIVSVRRLDKFLRRPDVDSVKDPKATTVAFSAASVAWPAKQDTPLDDRFVLRDVTITFPRGALSLVSGKTGTGKSLMLSAILGDADVLSGSVSVPPDMGTGRDDSRATAADWIVPGAMAYVAQIPWIENASIRDNIIFGLPLDRTRLDAVIDACALRKDVEMLEDGELSEIGANGINLSGGQKWRLTLARAVYSRADILIMDDVFSAVDAHVGSHILDKCLAGPLCAGRTTILVTHHIGLCRSVAKHLVELANGGVAYSGPIEDVPEDLIRFEEAEADREAEAVRQKQRQDEQNRLDEERFKVDDDEDERPKRRQTLEPEGPGATNANGADRKPRKFVEAEKRERGAIKKAVWMTYFEGSGGVWFVAGAVVIFIIFQAITMGRSWWVKVWTGGNDDMHPEGSSTRSWLSMGLMAAQTPSDDVVLRPFGEDHDFRYYVGIYMLISLTSLVALGLRCYYVCIATYRASESLFRQLTFTVLRTPLRWLDTTPQGRLLNRFTRDFGMMDDELLDAFNQALTHGFNGVGTLVSGIIVSPLIALFGLPLAGASWWLGINYVAGSRPCKRLSSTNLSGVMDLFVASVDGAATIRAFGCQQRYMGMIYEKIDDYAMSTGHFWLFYRWLGWRVTCLCAVFAGTITALVITDVRITASAAGFALSFAVGVQNTLFHTMRSATFLETSMNSAERILEYANETTEDQGGNDAPAAWPAEGRVDFEKLVVAYAPDLPPVLKGVSFSIRPGERVGIVGRTGAGKSSLTLALFRFLEAREGSISIDGIDLKSIKLQDLRSRLAIIPQDPVLFSGTIRTNLDPHGAYSDAQLQEALLRAHLLPSPSSSPPESSSASTTSATITTSNPRLSLWSPVSAGGLNLSQGQRQLLCLARAIVARPKIIILDEATSSIDNATDALIQRSIRDEFGGSTLMVVAHRLVTVADFDRVLVLGDGEVQEFGAPKELWEKEGGAFRGLCERSGDVERLKAMIGV